MNKVRREKLRKVAGLLSQTASIIDYVSCQEQDSLDNIPENLLGSERCERMEEVINLLEEAMESIEEAKNRIEDALL